MILYVVQIFRGMATPEAFLSVTDLNSLESDLCFERLWKDPFPTFSSGEENMFS